MALKPACRLVKMFRHLAGCHPRPNAPRSMVAKTVLTLLSVAAFCAVVPLSRAAGPPNDFCAGAELIPSNAGVTQPWYSTQQDIALATNSVGDPTPSCQRFVERNVWYSFTPDASARYTFAVCNDPLAPTATTVEDTVIALYRSIGGCTGKLVEEGCHDDGCGPGGFQSSLHERFLVAGTTYYIIVWQYFDPLDPPERAGVVQLRVTRSMAPPNDTCATATEARLNVPVFGSTAGAANHYQLPAASPCFNGAGASTAPGRDVVYWFTAPRAGDYNFRVYNYNRNNLVLYVAGSCPSNGVPAIVTTCLGAANRSPASTAEEVVCVSLAANQRVFIFVDEHDGFTTGSSFTLEVNECFREHEPNNAWTNANFIPCGLVGSIASASDVDFYHLGSPPAGWRAFVLVEGEAANITGFDLRLTTTSHTLEYDNQDNDAAFGQSAPNIAGTIMPGGPVYARVNYPFEAAEPYHIYAVVQPPMAAATLESEPNDTAAEANFHTLNYYRGVLSNAMDMDIFGITAAPGELIFTSLDADPTRANTPINAKVELVDEFENSLIRVDDGNMTSSTNYGAGLSATTPQSPAEAFVYRVANTGTYYIRVSISPGTVGPASAGDYLLSISKMCSVPTARFRSLVRTPDGTVRLEVEGVPRTSYRLQHSSDLNVWNSLPAQTADNNGIIQFQHATSGTPQRFYRVVSP